MQALGRNKASVTQDFHNAGGGNGINGQLSTSPYGLLVMSTVKEEQRSGKNGCSTLGGFNGSAGLPLVSDQLSLLQLLASAAVEQQRLQIHQSQQQQNAKTIATSNGQYPMMVSSPPATPTQLNPNSTNTTNIQQQPTTIASACLAGNASSEHGAANTKRRRLGSSNDKENLNHHLQAIKFGALLHYGMSNGGIATGSGTHDHPPSPDNKLNGFDRKAHGNYHNNNNNNYNSNNNNNNNNSSINNKNINDIFDRVYKKPQSTFLSGKQHYQPPMVTAKLAPAAAVDAEEDKRHQDGGKFSLSDFLRNHTEVSISTVPNGRRHDTINRDPPQSPSSDNNVADDYDDHDHDHEMIADDAAGREEKRNPRKQQQPRRLDDFDVVKLLHSGKPFVGVTAGIGDAGRVVDIRDKHMIRLIARRRCCQVCQNQRRYDHLDNCHYHTKISLILHMRWRHRREPIIRCKQCSQQFQRRYKLKLHHRLTGHSGQLRIAAHGHRKIQNGKANATALMAKVAAAAVAAAAATTATTTTTKPTSTAHPELITVKKHPVAVARKQRRRKARRFCFTRRRK